MKKKAGKKLLGGVKKFTSASKNRRDGAFSLAHMVIDVVHTVVGIVKDERTSTGLTRRFSRWL